MPGKIRGMKTLASALLASALLAGCNNGSKLDPMPAGGSASAASYSELAARVSSLEAWKAKHEKAIDFVQEVYDEQQAQIANQPDPSAVFAVPIADDVQAGQVEGPNTACVTIVEAWDFA